MQFASIPVSQRVVAKCGLILLWFLTQCGLPKSHSTETPAQSNESSSPAVKTASGDLSPVKEKRKPCVQEGGKFPDPISIVSVTQWMDTLPKPLSIPCVLDLLPRPLKIIGTKSELSVQPAFGNGSPRLFLKLGNLTLTVGLDGDRSDAIEMSEWVGGIQSVKGELRFPISGPLSSEQAFREVKRTIGVGSKCTACHFEESAAAAPFPANSFQSRALRPAEKHEVSVKELQNLRESCTDASSHRCEVLDAIFATGTPETFVFPSSWPTMF